MITSSGFTLLEVLLSLAIFTIIGIATVHQIQQVKSTKDAAFQELDLYDGVRAGLNLMRSDLSQSFHILNEDLGQETQQLLQRNQPVAHTLFDGRKKELIFTALSHRNYYAGRRESEQTEISYFLHDRQGAKNPTLMKRESEIIDDDLYQGGPIYSLIDNVIDMEFHYWDDKGNKWVEDWNSDAGNYRDRFPLAVQLKLVVVGPQNERLDVETKFKVGFPNNDPQVTQF